MLYNTKFLGDATLPPGCWGWAWLLSGCWAVLGVFTCCLGGYVTAGLGCTAALLLAHSNLAWVEKFMDSLGFSLGLCLNS